MSIKCQRTDVVCVHHRAVFKYLSVLRMNMPYVKLSERVINYISAAIKHQVEEKENLNSNEAWEVFSNVFIFIPNRTAACPKM